METSEQLNCFTHGAVAYTSKEAYKEVREDLKTETIRDRINRTIEEKGPITRNELSRLLNLRINVVCGRVSELLKIGAIEEGKPRKDPWTKSLNKTLISR